ncbi:MAG: hypothetical protein ACI95S_001758 [Dinoroseobacter sp.]|jgi:hypothetical protein
MDFYMPCLLIWGAVSKLVECLGISAGLPAREGLVYLLPGSR